MPLYPLLALGNHSQPNQGSQTDSLDLSIGFLCPRLSPRVERAGKTDDETSRRAGQKLVPYRPLAKN